MNKDEIGKNNEFTKDNNHFKDKELEMGMKEKAYYNIYEELNSSDDTDINTELVDEWVNVLDNIMKPSKRITEPDVDAFILKTLKEYERIKRVKSKSYMNKILKKVASLVFIFIISSVVVSQAFNISIWDYFVQWGEETFSLKANKNEKADFKYELSEVTSKEYSSFEKAIEELNVQVMIPKYIPKGYVLQNVQVTKSSNRIDIIGVYLNDDKLFSYSIQILEKDSIGVSKDYEKDNETLEIIKINHIKYYLMSNLEVRQAVWNISNVVYTISGNLSTEEIKMIINSMNN